MNGQISRCFKIAKYVFLQFVEKILSGFTQNNACQGRQIEFGVRMYHAASKRFANPDYTILFKTFATSVDLQILKNVKVDFISKKVGHP